ncbi:MAG: TlpA family protein disulfide reductase [Candidatus Eremiobacteraeota bacterium]|nr:TlpA family protein disulfide reductase [Candidatus Eremiobacteraeota bacterium]MCW5869022.1 TlpA family protein disulfide reductase [Candidatus Eremiobacteraeota bacterium]
MKWLLWLLLSGAVTAQTLVELDGRQVSLDELRRAGKPLVLMTWCSHCACCRSGEKTLLELARRYPEMEMRALDAQFGDDAKQVQGYLQRQKLRLPVLFDPRGGLCRLLGIRTSTTALVWDTRGEMRYFGNLAGLPGALKQLHSGQAVVPPSTPQQGCPILFLEHLDKRDRP